jgi:hypothetical protein
MTRRKLPEYHAANITGGTIEAKQAMRSLASDLGVLLELDMKGETWRLAMLSRTRDNPGAGAIVLQTLHALADKECATIELHAGPTRRRNAKLVRYYQEFGYKTCATWGNDMFRLPSESLPDAPPKSPE